MAAGDKVGYKSFKQINKERGGRVLIMQWAKETWTFGRGLKGRGEGRREQSENGNKNKRSEGIGIPCWHGG